MNVQNIKTKDLVPYVRNQKKHDKKQIDNVAESIKQFGMVQPIVVDKDNNVIIGHCRLLACQKLAIEEVPVVKLEELTAEQANKLRLLDNKLNESDWDFDILTEDIPELDWEGFDIDWELPKELQPEEEKKVVEVSVPEEVKTRCKKGDIWKLGNHRLICGSSTDEKDIEKLMNGEKADLVLTDPPYNVAIGDKNKNLNEKNGSKSIEKNILGDSGMTDEECGEKLWKPAFINALNSAKDDCAIYCFMPQGGTHMMMMMMMKEAGWKVKHELIWVKNAAAFSMGRLDYDYQHEPILYGWNKSHNFYSSEYQTSILEDEIDIDKLKKEELLEILKEFMNEKHPVSVIRENKPLKNDLHPTMKPIKLLARLIKNSSKEDNNILDLFGGSGSTLIACEQLNRKCFMCELDPHYCDVILTRWETLTGKKAEKIAENQKGNRCEELRITIPRKQE